jgi:hypothetical protein
MTAALITLLKLVLNEPRAFNTTEDDFFALFAEEPLDLLAPLCATARAAVFASFTSALYSSTIA